MFKLPPFAARAASHADCEPNGPSLPLLPLPTMEHPGQYQLK
jgi:hypothetical protein